MEKEKNIMLMVIYFLKENIYIIKKEKEKNMLIINQNMKENIYIIKNGMVKDMMKIVILYMNYLMVLEK